MDIDCDVIGYEIQREMKGNAVTNRRPARLFLQGFICKNQCSD